MFKEKGFSHNDQEKRGHSYIFFFLKKESQSESGTNGSAHEIICNIIPHPIPHPKEGKTILIVYSNKNTEWTI